MRIHFDNVNLSSSSGPNSFAQRLRNYLIEEGHRVDLDNGIDSDISLVFIEHSGSTLAKKVVQRLDGIWFSPQEFETKNIRIKKLYNSANYVVWQSEFDKKMTEKWWGNRSGSVIRNGISITDNLDIKLQSQIDALKKKHEKIFVCSANWHSQKRLKDNIGLFNHLKEKYPTSCLIVMGSNGNASIKDVYITGSLTHEHCIQIFKNCDWMLHLAWLDHCPNTVIEAISCGVPVICSEEGGTKEIVGEYGIILKENLKYDFELTNYDSPPRIDLKQINGLLPEKSSLGCPPNLSIKNSAEKYLRVFKNLLEDE